MTFCTLSKTKNALYLGLCTLRLFYTLLVYKLSVTQLTTSRTSNRRSWVKEKVKRLQPTPASTLTRAAKTRPRRKPRRVRSARQEIKRWKIGRSISITSKRVHDPAPKTEPNISARMSWDHDTRGGRSVVQVKARYIAVELITSLGTTGDRRQ